MIEINARQGSIEWLQARARCFCASEANSMMGVSPYKTRSALIAEKATGIIPEVDAATQARFDMGHMTEALARTIIEQIVGEELFPIVATDDTGKYLASSDGSTMLVNIGYEHKLWNEKLATEVAQGNVPESHRWQLDHQFLVFGFEKIIFVVSDGTAEKMVHCWYYPQPERIKALVEGWEQFEKDVAAYVPTDIKEMPKADVTVELPALFVHAKGEITTHNMDEFGKALSAKLAETRAIVLVTDQDFSNAKEAAKKFRETAKAIALSKEQMLAQTETIGEAARKMDTWAADLNKTALQLEKDVEREDKAKKEVMVLGGKDAYAEHVAALESETAPIRLNLVAPNFADAIKGKRNYASMQDAVDTMLAGAKVEADAAAKDVRGKLAWCKENAAGHSALFPDLQQIIFKPMDDFTLTINSRIAKAKADEEARLEAEREKIRAEEQAKAQREAAEKAAAEKREAEAKAAEEQAERDRIAAEEIRQQDADRKAVTAQPALQSVNEAITREFSQTYPNGAPMFDKSNIKENGDPVMLNPDGKRSVFCDVDEGNENPTGKTMNLGQINAALGFTVSADFLGSLGMLPVRQEKAAKLYDANKLPTICRLIQEHLAKVMQRSFKMAA